MNDIQKGVKDFMMAAEQSCPSKPIIPDEKTRILRVRLLIEEALELAEASGVKVTVPFKLKAFEPQYIIDTFSKEHEENMARAKSFNYPEQAGISLSLDIKDLEFTVVQDADILEVADALADINYVSYGAAIAYGLDLQPFEEEVQRSNMSKFIDGHKDENGKWIKGPSYKPVDFKPILEKQLNEETV